MDKLATLKHLDLFRCILLLCICIIINPVFSEDPHSCGDPCEELLVKINGTTCDTITVTWNCSGCYGDKVTLSYSVSTPSKSYDWQDSRPRYTSWGHGTITDLISNTNYAIRANYSGKLQNTIYAATLPGPPNPPSISINDMKVSVQRDGGSAVQLYPSYKYILEWREMSGRDSPHKFFGEWANYGDPKNIEDRDPHWKIDEEDLKDDKSYQFRVYLSPKDAKSADIFCERSDTSRYVNLHYKHEEELQPNEQISIAIAVSLVVVVSAVGLIYWRRKVYLRRKLMKRLLPTGDTTIYLPGNGADKELTQIRNLTTLAIAAARHDRDIPENFEKKPKFYFTR